MKKSQNRKKEIKFWDNISKKERNWILKTPKEEIIKKIKSSKEHWWEELIGKVRGKKILDIGCGPCGSLEWADMVLERIGLDPLTESYSSLGINKHKMKYVASGVENIPFKDGYFDVVSSFNSLDHVDNLKKAINEIIRVLAPGGIFLLITDVNHHPTPCEPIKFSWDIIEKFTQKNMKLIEAKYYEKSEEGIYQSILANIPYDHHNKTKRYGILSAKFIKLQQRRL